MNWNRTRECALAALFASSLLSGCQEGAQVSSTQGANQLGTVNGAVTRTLQCQNLKTLADTAFVVVQGAVDRILESEKLSGCAPGTIPDEPRTSYLSNAVSFDAGVGASSNGRIDTRTLNGQQSGQSSSTSLYVYAGIGVNFDLGKGTRTVAGACVPANESNRLDGQRMLVKHVMQKFVQQRCQWVNLPASGLGSPSGVEKRGVLSTDYAKLGLRPDNFAAGCSTLAVRKEWVGYEIANLGNQCVAENSRTGTGGGRCGLGSNPLRSDEPVCRAASARVVTTGAWGQLSLSAGGQFSMSSSSANGVFGSYGGSSSSNGGYVGVFISDKKSRGTTSISQCAIPLLGSTENCECVQPWRTQYIVNVFVPMLDSVIAEAGICKQEQVRTNPGETDGGAAR